MMDLILLYLGSGLTVIWGVAHLFPTKSVVQGFGEISICSGSNCYRSIKCCLNRRLLDFSYYASGNGSVIFVHRI
jgi:hypothetical protein